jgi:hypothetical protein
MKQTVNGVDVVVDYDHFPFNPIDGIDVKFILFHKRYNLGHKHDVKHEDYSGWDEMRSDLESQYDYVCPVYMYEHLGIAFKTTSFGDRWDSGQIGFACANYKDFGLTEWQDLDSIVCSLLQEYENYINGFVYAAFLYDSETGELIDSMGGFSSEDEAMQSAIKVATSYTTHG